MARKIVNLQKNPLLSGPTLEARAKGGNPYRELSLNDIDVDPDQPRRNFDAQALAELAVSIKEHGVLCPILVRVTAGGSYRVVAGERRFKAAKLAGLETIPAVIDSSDSEEVVKLEKQLVENLQRLDLMPVERAKAIGQLKDQYSLSVRDIASRLGVSKGLVQRSLEILSLPADLLAVLEEGASESKVLALAKITDPKKRRELLAQLDNLSRGEIEAYVSRNRVLKEGSLSHGGTERKRGLKLSHEDQRIVAELQESLRTRVELLRKASNQEQGRVIIEFYSNDDLQELYRKLLG